MEHLTLKAVTTTQDQDQGVFTAVISTSSIDREKDVVDPAGMVAALQKWTSTGKQIPLAWNHSTAADQIIGSIDPASAKDVNGEVVVDGRIDQSTDTGAHAWRLVKAGVVGFSFGYLILKGSPRKGGGRSISELDVFEITATPTPMNNDTRVLDYKGQMTTNEARATLSFPAHEGDDPLFPGSELDGAIAGELKAAWTTAYVNDLPDSAFLYVAPGGDKDSDGKTTPRSLRYFPVKDASGAVDQAHVRNALSRIPQADLSQSIKDAAAAKAQRLLDTSKSVEGTSGETRSHPTDPLRAKAMALALEFASDGLGPEQPPPPPQEPPDEVMSLEAMRRWHHDIMLTILSEGLPE